MKRGKKEGCLSSRWLLLIDPSVFFTFQHTCPPHPPPSSSASRSPTFVCLHRPIFGQPLRQWRRSRPDNLIKRQSQGQRARHNPCRAFSSKHFYPPSFAIYFLGRVVASPRKRITTTQCYSLSILWRRFFWTLGAQTQHNWRSMKQALDVCIARSSSFV